MICACLSLWQPASLRKSQHMGYYPLPNTQVKVMAFNEAAFPDLIYMGVQVIVVEVMKVEI